MKTANILCIGMALVALSGCKGAQEAAMQPAPQAMQTRPAAKASGVSMMPKAIVYKTNGDYADNVAVTLNADGTALVSYPAVSDVSAQSAPIAIGDGWLLDRRGGISQRTAFLTYTYDEYAKLPSTPSASELMRCVIPGAKVTDAKVLPITYGQAEANPAACLQYVK